MNKLTTTTTIIRKALLPSLVLLDVALFVLVYVLLLVLHLVSLPLYLGVGRLQPLILQVHAVQLVDQRLAHSLQLLPLAVRHVKRALQAILVTLRVLVRPSPVNIRLLSLVGND